MSPEGTRWSHPDADPHRPAVRRHHRARPGGPHLQRDLHRLARPVGAHRHPGAGRTRTARWSALVAVGITVDRVGAELRRQLPALVLAVLAVLAAGRGRQLADLAAVAAADLRPRPGRAGPDVRLLRRRPALGARGPAAGRRRRPAPAGQRGGRAAARRCRTTPAGARWPTSACPATWWRRSPVPTRWSTSCSWPATGSWPVSVALVGADGGRRGHPARPHRPAARSPASSTPPAASPRRCARPSTRPPTGCTPWWR